MGVAAGSLCDIRPSIDGAALVARFTPPRRFADVRFATYRPSPDHPSQGAALADLEAFAATLATGGPEPAGPSGRWFRRGRRAPSGPPAARPGRYLDGGFGVGKTHLLASLWFSCPGPAAYLSFSELTAVIGFLGLEGAVEAFRPYRLLCLDEFELDDVANTIMAVSFLRALVPGGLRVAATSNTLPDRLGQGRFAADDFAREISAIASWFEVVRIDGPDYRARARPDAGPVDAEAQDAWVGRHLAAGARVTRDDLAALLGHLRRVHPVQLGPMLDEVDAVAVDELRPIGSQDEALLFVNLVDELYDAQVAFSATGCGVGELFPATYRHGGYRAKYGRCESRLAAMLGEAAGGSAPGVATVTNA